MAYTPTLIVAASNLTNNVGLAPNTAMFTMAGTISSNDLVSLYDDLKPGTSNGTILDGAGYSVEDLNLPSFITEVTDTFANVELRANTMLPNVSTFATLLTIAGSFASLSYRMSSALKEFSDISFDSLGIDVNSHQTSVTNGIANMLVPNPADLTPEETKQNLTTFADAIKNFGKCYDVSNLSKLGDPATFATHLINNGYELELPSDWLSLNSKERKAYLDQIVGPVFTRVITLSGIKLPAGNSVSSLGDLLELNQVFPKSALDLVPGKDFAGLANIFVNLGGKFKNFNEVADLFGNMEIPSVNHLAEYSTPVPSFDYSSLTQKMGHGAGPYGNNPLITDLVGTVAGIPHLENLTAIDGYLSRISTLPSTTTLIDRLTDLQTACSGGDIPTAFAAALSAADTFNADPVVSAIVESDTTIETMQTHLQLEVDNLSLVNVNLSSLDNGGVPSVLGLVNNLHDYGADKEQLNYSQLFAGIAEANAGGEAVLASIAEGKNLSIQAQYSVPVSTKSSSN